MLLAQVQLLHIKDADQDGLDGGFRLVCHLSTPVLSSAHTSAPVGGGVARSLPRRCQRLAALRRL